MTHSRGSGGGVTNYYDHLHLGHLRGLSSHVQWVQGCSCESHLCPSPLPQKKSKVHYHVAVIINYLGHCISLVALLVAFVLFLRLR